MAVLHAGEPRVSAAVSEFHSRRDNSPVAPTTDTHPTPNTVRRVVGYATLVLSLATVAVAGVAWRANNSNGNPSQTNICNMETAHNQVNSLGPNTDPACNPTP